MRSDKKLDQIKAPTQPALRNWGAHGRSTIIPKTVVVWRGHTLAAGLAFAILRLGLMLATVQMSRPLARSDRSPITTVYYKLACDRTGYLVRL